MELEKEKLVKAKLVLHKMAHGINPLNGESIDSNHFLQDSRIIRCLFFVEEILEKVIEGQVRIGKAPADFKITALDKSKVELPGGKIGVNEFAKQINKMIDLNQSKKLTGLELNKQLKKMGILSEEALGNGKTRTTINSKSGDYGIETEKRNFNGNEYEMVLFNSTGQKFLLDNLDTIMNYQEETKTD